MILKVINRAVYVAIGFGIGFVAAVACAEMLQ